VVNVIVGPGHWREFDPRAMPESDSDSEKGRRVKNTAQASNVDKPIRAALGRNK